MGMMPLRINTFFHAFQQSVYSIFMNSNSLSQEENDQAFSITL
jgi:hypothetical protein